MAAITQDSDLRTPTAASSSRERKGRRGRIARIVVLAIGAVIFLFPFYYMIIGSLQRDPDTGIGGAFPELGNLTLDNYSTINASVNLWRTLANSGIFTGGVLLLTVIFGLLAGYAMSILHWRGRGVAFAAMVLIQVVPFQLLMIPLYTLIVRSYGLADNYLGMILPFAINSTAVFVFRQFFLALPRDLFESARIDGASELRILWSIAVPLARPAILTAVILTFIGPWNDFLWPFLVTKDAHLQPLAVALANYISTVAASVANPYGAILAGACVLALPAVGIFILFQRHFVSSDLGSGVKG